MTTHHPERREPPLVAGEFVTPAAEPVDVNPANDPAPPSEPSDATFGLREGSLVLAADGEEVGAVAETQSQYFRVDAPMRQDFWLNLDLVSSVEDGQVRLTISSEDLDAYGEKRPPTGDALLSPAEQQTQRERMEAELAAQRERLPH